MNVLMRFLSLPARWLSKIPGLGPFVAALSTTVGQKLLMAGTGLALCGFLVAHLAGNLKLYAGEQAFNDYARALHSLGPVLAAAEIGLFATFALHIGLAMSTAAMNRQARKKDYALKDSKQGIFILPGGASSWMMVTGLLVLTFLCLHILDMKLRANPGVDYRQMNAELEGDGNTFQVVTAVLTTPVNAFAYLIGIVALGIHLSHGVRSALQTLGLNFKRWNTLLVLAGYLFAWSIAGGFISLIAWAAATRS